MEYLRCKYCGGTGTRKNFREVIECTGCGAPSEKVTERPIPFAEAVRLASWSMKEFDNTLSSGVSMPNLTDESTDRVWG